MSVRVGPASSCLLLLALAFARGVTGVALGLLLGLQTLLLGLFRFLGLSRLGAGGGLSFALGLTALHFGIVESRLGAKLVQNVLPRLHRGLLAVREVRFLESTHKRGLVAFTFGVGCAKRAECA